MDSVTGEWMPLSRSKMNGHRWAKRVRWPVKVLQGPELEAQQAQFVERADHIPCRELKRDFLDCLYASVKLGQHSSSLVLLKLGGFTGRDNQREKRESKENCQINNTQPVMMMMTLQERRWYHYHLIILTLHYWIEKKYCKLPHSTWQHYSIIVV